MGGNISSWKCGEARCAAGRPDVGQGALRRVVAEGHESVGDFGRDEWAHAGNVLPGFDVHAGLPLAELEQPVGCSSVPK